jgi:hypothetical protein
MLDIGSRQRHSQFVPDVNALALKEQQSLQLCRLAGSGQHSAEVPYRLAVLASEHAFGTKAFD